MYHFSFYEYMAARPIVGPVARNFQTRRDPQFFSLFELTNSTPFDCVVIPTGTLNFNAKKEVPHEMVI